MIATNALHRSAVHALLLRREAEGRLRVGVIGAGNFGTMCIAQVPRTPGVHLVRIADFAPDRAREDLLRVGWEPAAFGAASLDPALRERRTCPSDDWRALVYSPKTRSSPWRSSDGGAARGESRYRLIR